MRHKHADIIIEWAETGKTVQARKGPFALWQDIDEPFWNEHQEYRFKPEVVRYKRYMAQVKAVYYVAVHQYEHSDPKHHSHFVKWIDTDWQEVEV